MWFILCVRYEDAEWLQHVGRDGSLLYVESYVSSTVREKQVQALKASGTADRKTPYSPPPKDIKKKSEHNHLYIASSSFWLWYS